MTSSWLQDAVKDKMTQKLGQWRQSYPTIKKPLLNENEISQAFRRFLVFRHKIETIAPELNIQLQK
jgi:hypothetical protein